MLKSKQFCSVSIFLVLLSLIIITNLVDVKSVNASNYESESNNTFVTANTISYGTQMLGMISSSSDVDYFKFTASNGNVLHVNLSKVPSGRDYDIQIIL